MKRLILKGIDRSQIIGAGVGCLLGFSILLGGAQLFLDIRSMIQKESEIWEPGYFIINKKVSMLDGVTGRSTGFDSSELAKIADKLFVKDLAPFRTANFRISASTRERANIPGFHTQLFFEAVPDRFLDVDEAEWDWRPDDEFIPLVVPSHYIALYNFGFAQSQGLPQISKSLIQRVSFRIQLAGNGKKKSYKSRVVAFSERINSILVPLDLLEWANERFGRGAVPEPSRLVVITDDPSGSGLFAFADQEGYEIQGGDRNTGRLASLLRAGVWIVGGTAGIIILLASWLLIISFRLLIVKNRSTIQKLHLLGYPLSSIRRVYSFLVGVFSVIVLVGASLVTLILRAFYTRTFGSVGFEVEGMLSIWPFLIGILVLLVINGVNELLLGRQLKVAIR